MHTCKSHSIPFCLCRYRKVPSDRCEGGFSPQLIKQTVKACGIKPSPAPPAMSTSSVTHFDTPVSRLIVLFQSLLHFIKLSFVWININLFVYFPARKAGVDPGVCRSSHHRPHSYCFCCDCCQESDL